MARIAADMTVHRLNASIIVSPTDRWLREALADARRSFVVASPYIGAYLSNAITKLASQVRVRLLTRTLLTDFASKASDLEAVASIAERTGTILSLSSLHAKVYIVGSRVLVTSANATASGMFRNQECGLQFKSEKAAKQLSALVSSGFGSSQRPEPWTVEELQALREPVERLRASLPKRLRLQSNAIEAPPRIQLSRRDYAELVSSFTGWLRLTMTGISTIKADVFTMSDVLAACSPLAAEEFPANRYVREKLRQQMQRLRDLGLVAFLGGGRYELLARPR